MKILLASDHAGYDLKQALVPFVESLGHEVEDLGAHEYDDDDDYVDYVRPAAARVSIDPNRVRAIVLGGSGQGEAIGAGIRPAPRPESDGIPQRENGIDTGKLQAHAPGRGRAQPFPRDVPVHRAAARHV